MPWGEDDAVNTEPPEQVGFTSAAASAIVEVLRGNAPVIPPDLGMPGWLSDSLSPDIEDKVAWVRQQWGWLAITWWCRFKLSAGQRSALQRQHYDLNELGNDFLLYLTSDEGATGVAIRTPASYILASAHPAAVLSEWFGRFLASASGPFERSVCWKLKRRLDDVLGADRRFVRVGEAWRLAEPSTAPRNGHGTAETHDIKEHLAATVGPIRPFIYKARDHKLDASDAAACEEEERCKKDMPREDPLISGKDAVRVATAAIGCIGPMTSWELAMACRDLLPEVLWCEIMRDTDGREDRQGAEEDSDGDDPDWLVAEHDGAPTETADGSVSPEHLLELASGVWTKLSPAQRIVAAARLFQDPPWTLQQIQDWTVTNLLHEFQMKLQRVYDRAGRDDVRIMAEVRDITPEWLFEDCQREELCVFYAAMGEEARKMLAVPPSSWVRQAQERRSPAHE